MSVPQSLNVSAVCAVVAAAFLALAGCGSQVGGDRPPQPGDRAVAKVEDQTIWASDVKREAVAQGLISEGEPLDVTSDLFRRTLEEVIDQKLLAREAKRLRLDKSPLAKRRLDAAL
jgi:peptidyl-prolyl cis-trans isomerase C